MNPEGLYECVEESLSRPTHRKWMWGGPGKTVHCVSTETIAIQQNPMAAFMIMFRAVSFLWALRIYSWMCVNGANRQIFSFWIDPFLRPKPSFLTGNDRLCSWLHLCFVFLLVWKAGRFYSLPDRLCVHEWGRKKLPHYALMFRKQKNAPLCYSNPYSRAFKCLTNGDF